MRDLPFVDTANPAYALDVETATFRFSLREGTELDRDALGEALKEAGFELHGARLEPGA